MGQAPLASPNSTSGHYRDPGVLELNKHVWTHIANFGQSCMKTDASSINMCNKLNSVYWAFHI